MQRARRKLKNFLELKENENTTYLILWDTMKALLKVHSTKRLHQKKNSSNISQFNVTSEISRKIKRDNTPKQYTGANNKTQF